MFSLFKKTNSKYFSSVLFIITLFKAINPVVLILIIGCSDYLVILYIHIYVLKGFYRIFLAFIANQTNLFVILIDYFCARHFPLYLNQKILNNLNSFSFMCSYD
jgi:hypothetical protein